MNRSGRFAQTHSVFDQLGVSSIGVTETEASKAFEAEPFR